MVGFPGNAAETVSPARVIVPERRPVVSACRGFPSRPPPRRRAGPCPGARRPDDRRSAAAAGRAPNRRRRTRRRRARAGRRRVPAASSSFAAPKGWRSGGRARNRPAAVAHSVPMARAAPSSRASASARNWGVPDSSTTVSPAAWCWRRRSTQGANHQLRRRPPHPAGHQRLHVGAGAGRPGTPCPSSRCAGRTRRRGWRRSAGRPEVAAGPSQPRRNSRRNSRFSVLGPATSVPSTSNTARAKTRGQRPDDSGRRRLPRIARRSL